MKKKTIVAISLTVFLLLTLIYIMIPKESAEEKELEEFFTKDYQTKDKSEWTVKDLMSQGYYEQGVLPKAVGKEIYDEMPSSLKELYISKVLD